MKSKEVILVLICLLLAVNKTSGQIAVKSNILGDAVVIPNIGVEVGISPKFTIDVPFYYNPWKYSDTKQYKLMLVQPEVRYWLCDKFNGHFFGINGMIGVYNVMGIKPPFALWKDMKDYRYKGEFYGGGISYGYQFVLGHHWNIEANIGVGYAYVKYKKYPCENCGEMIEKSHKNYFGPTKAAISLVYLF